MVKLNWLSCWAKYHPVHHRGLANVDEVKGRQGRADDTPCAPACRQRSNHTAQEAEHRQEKAS